MTISHTIFFCFRIILFTVFRFIYLFTVFRFICLFVCLFGFCGVSTFVDYLTPNPFLNKWTVLFQTIQFSIITTIVPKILFNAIQFSQTVLKVQSQCQKQFYFKQFSLALVHSLIVKKFLFQAIQFNQTVLIQTIQFNIWIVFVNTQLNVKTVLFEAIQFSISTQFTCQNSFISSNYVYDKYAGKISKQFYFK